VLLIPYEIETLEQERPWANWSIIGLITLVSFGWFFGILSDEQVEPLVLQGWHPAGLLGHMFLHADLIHWLGNMIFLWVFGNAVCTNIGNFTYLIVFTLCALAAEFIHNLADGSPAIGASGALNGITGMVLAMYPLNRINVFYLIFIKGGSFTCPAWVVILLWFLFDVIGAVSGGGMIAYWAHIGGLVGGLAIGLVCMQFGWILLTEYDNRSLLEILKRERRD
jgi:membrane associated rhomboid family serine protease